MDSPKRILIVEDEATFAGYIKDYLVQAGMTADVHSNGADAVELILRTAPHLVILDVMLPGKDGLTICREIRAASQVPIILQTAKVEEIDRLLGLELGADDYICKPYSPRELVARVKALLRRSAFSAAVAPAASTSRLVMDADRWNASIDGSSLGLTRREFQILGSLHARPSVVLSRSQLLDAIAGDTDVVDRTVDSHIKNLRNKIKAVDPDWDPIRSVYGVGYAFEE